MKSDTFVVLSSMLKSAKCLEDNLRNELCYVIMEYGFNDELVECSPIIKAIMMSIIPNINSSKVRYKASVDNGKLGGRPPKHKPSDNLDKPSDNLEETKHKPKHNLDKDKDKDKDKDRDVDKDIIVIPTFSFSLAKDTHFSKLSDEYISKLKYKIYNFNGALSFEDFEMALLSKSSYKYKDFWLTYQNWNKRENTKQQSRYKSFKQQDNEKARNNIDAYLDSGISLRDNQQYLESEVIEYDN